MFSQLVPTLAQSTSSSLMLKLPKIKPNPDGDCALISLPAPHYHIYYSYKSCLDDEVAACDIKTIEKCKYNVL